MSRRPCAFYKRDIPEPLYQFAVGDGSVAHLVCLNASKPTPPRRYRWFRRAVP